ncbi:MAG: 4a-hydroxytetrahydrobiopterin dehydratase [Planctomycetota bacterium]
MAEPLTDDAIQTALGDLPGWGYAEDRLSKTFGFGGFGEAMSFIVRVGFEAEAANHHPELRNVYSKVEVLLATHDAGGKVTQKDIDLARTIEELNWIPDKD